MVRNFRLKLALFLTAVAFPGFVLASGIDVPANDPVYDFLNRLETRGVIHGYNSLVLPLTRDEIAAFLGEATQMTAALSGVESAILQEYIADYRYEIESRKTAQDSVWAPFYQKKYLRRAVGELFCRENGVEENHLLRYESGETFFWFDVGARGRMDWKDNHQKQLFSDEYLFRGALGKALTFHTGFSRFAVSHNPAFTEPYDEERGLWSMFQADSTITFDNIQSSLVYHNPCFDLGFYRQPLSWGASGTNNLVISPSAPLFSYIGFNTRYKDVRLTFIHGSLMHDSTQYRNIPAEERNRSKYIVAHRIDIPFFKKRLFIGLSEMVIYGDRHIELSYLAPAGVFWAIGHALEDRDNILMAADFKANLRRNFSVYGSLLIDEMRFGELGKRWWANKHAVQAGILLTPVLFAVPVDIQMEFTAVRPWTYSHKTLTTDYTQNGICLGFPYGANSQTWYFKLESEFSRRLSISGEFLHLRQGIDDATHYWGGDPTVSYELRDPQYDHSTKWLMGDLQTTNQLTISSRYELFNDFFLNAGINFYDVKLNGNHESNRFLYIETDINF